MQTIEKYSTEINQMAREDLGLRDKLVERSNLSENYNSQMENLHIKNGKLLLKIIYEVGFPSTPIFSEEVCHNAWLIVQHAISLPDLQKKVLVEITELSKNGSFSKINVAMLLDRVSYFSKGKQIYGTQFDWDKDKQLNPWPIENQSKVNQL